MQTYYEEFINLMKSCDQIQRDDINCYILKTMYNLAKKFTYNRYEIILEAYTLLLQNLEHIKLRYNEKKADFKTYIYFYIRKYLYYVYEKYQKRYEKEVHSLLFNDEEYDYLLEMYYSNEDYLE